jgi:hypothetical protein
MPDLSVLKDTDIESKITDLTNKYFIAVKLRNSDLCNQIIMGLDQCRDELNRRNTEKSKKVMVNDKNKDLDDLINIS